MFLFAVLNYVLFTLLIVCPIVIVIIVRYIRKRKDTFLTVVPVLLFVYGLFSMVLLIIYGLEAAQSMNGHWMSLTSLFIGLIAFLLAHFIFAVQYFKTSLILPKLFTKTKIEWLQKNNSNS